MANEEAWHRTGTAASSSIIAFPYIDRRARRGLKQRILQAEPGNELGGVVKLQRAATGIDWRSATRADEPPRWSDRHAIQRGMSARITGQAECRENGTGSGFGRAGTVGHGGFQFSGDRLDRRISMQRLA